jgi:O-antigen/teichoic acid export membrane protein
LFKDLLKLNKVISHEVGEEQTNYLNSFWTFIGMSIQKGGMFVLNFILVFILNPDGFGDFSIVKASATTFTSVLLYFINMSVAQYVSDDSNDNNLTLRIRFARKITWTLTLVGIILLVFLEPYASEILEKSEFDQKKYFLMILLFATSLLASSELGIIVAIKKTKILTKANLISFLFLIVTIVLAFAFGSNGALIGLVLFYFVQLLSQRILIKSFLKIPSNYSFDFPFKEIGRYLFAGIPLIASTIVTAVPFYYFKLDLYVHSGSASYGLFEFGYQFYVIAFNITNSIVISLIPFVSSNSYAEDGKKKIRKVYSKYIKILLAINTIVILCSLTISWIIEKVKYSEYSGLFEIVLLLMLASLPYSFFLINEKVLIGYKRFWTTFFSHFLYIGTLSIYLFYTEVTVNNLVLGLILGYSVGCLFSYLALKFDCNKSLI